MASIVPPKRTPALANTPAPEQRTAMFARDAAMMEKPQNMARLLSWTLADLLLSHQEIIVAGEDVGPKGGVYNCHRQAARALRLRAGHQHPARRAEHPRPRHRRRA